MARAPAKRAAAGGGERRWADALGRWSITYACLFGLVAMGVDFAQYRRSGVFEVGSLRGFMLLGPLLPVGLIANAVAAAGRPRPLWVAVLAGCFALLFGVGTAAWMQALRVPFGP
jgi:hypothetical protein